MSLMMWSSGAFAQATLNVVACPSCAYQVQRLLPLPATSGAGIPGGTVVDGFTLSVTETDGNLYTSGNGDIA
jgi:hypothetical protein